MPGISLPERGLVSQARQAMIEAPHVPRSRFVDEWFRLTTFNQGALVPFMVEEVYPGDHIRLAVSAYLRLDTPLFPIFSNFRVETFFFFCPTRLLWVNFKKFMGEQDNPGDSISFTIPQYTMPVGGFAINSLFDHLGLPTVGQVAAGGVGSFNALPIRMYGRVWNEWFRSQDLQSSFVVPTGDGPDSGAYALLNRGKNHDYFTTALLAPQKFTAPTVPLAGEAPVRGIGMQTGVGNAWPGLAVGAVNEANLGTATSYATALNSATENIVVRTSGQGVFADLTAAAGVSINVLRQAFMVQQLLERDARGGTRYTEKVRSHFGVTSPDARLQRTEYIGGGSSPLVVTPIAQTAPGVSGTVGFLGGAGTAYGDHSASYAATEHGYLMGIANVRSELAYQQGVRRMWTRSVQTDFYFPSFAQLGEQAILRKEIYFRGVPAEDDTVFGYAPRYEELRTHTSEVTGMFRSTHAGTIDPWHAVQRFNPAPVLGSTFIQDTAPMDRILAAGAAANNLQFKAQFLIRMDATRPLPVFGTPALLGRF